MNNDILESAGLSQAQTLQLAQSLHAKGVDDADIYFEHSVHEGWSLEEGRVKSGSSSIDRGVGVRAIAGEKTAFAYSDEISFEAIKQATQTVRVIAKMGGNVGGKAGGKSVGGKTVGTKPQRETAQKKSSLDKTALQKNLIQRSPLYAYENPITGLQSADKIKLLERLEQFAKACDPRVKQVMANLSAEHSMVLCVRADGTQAADVRPLLRIGLEVIAEQAGRRESGYAGGGGRYELARFDDAYLKQLAKQAVDSALVNLEARPAPAGMMSVVLGPGWPGILLHEAIGHGLEADAIRKGSSAFAGLFGQQIAAKGVTVVDDGTLAHRRGSLNMDDEGTPTQCTTLIEDGILVNCLQDRMNARLMGRQVTGNARRESYACVPLPRMTNTYMLNGQRDPAEIIAGLEKGIYCSNFGGGQVDTTSGKFVFSCTEAWYVEGGKLLYPVKGATLIGNGADALRHITQIGNDMALDTGVGVCGKEGQSVPVGVGQPTLRIEGLTVGGTA